MHLHKPPKYGILYPKNGMACGGHQPDKLKRSYVELKPSLTNGHGLVAPQFVSCLTTPISVN